MDNRISWRWLAIAVCLALWLGGLPASVGAPARADQGTVTLAGDFWIVWGDPLDCAGPSAPIAYQLATSGGIVPLRLEGAAQPAGGLLALHRRQVQVVGTWQDTELLVQAIRPAQPDALAMPSGLIGSQPWVSVLCKFRDYPAEPKDLPYFEGMYSDQFPGLDHYWRQVSYANIDLLGSDAVGWYTLPQPRSYYVYDNDGDGEVELDWGRAADDCTLVADPDVYFPSFVGINLMFNADLDCCAWGGSWYINRDGQNRLYRVTWEPPWGYGNIGVIAHETGHGFGLPHSSGDYGQVYDNRWDVMSDIWTDCGNLTDPTYGCVGQGTISYHLDIEGWVPAARKATVATGGRQTLTLLQLHTLPGSDYSIAIVPIDDSATHFYTVEARKKVVYDAKLPAEGVIIHEVDTGRGEPAHVVDVDRDGNTGDAYFGVGQTFLDAAAGIEVRVDAAVSQGWTVTIANRFDEPTPFHVMSITMKVQSIGDRTLVRGAVRIGDLDHQVVPGAVVKARWTLPDGRQKDVQAVTGSKGQAAFSVNARQAGSYQLCVVDVLKEGYVYVPEQNHESCDSASVP